MRDESIIIPCSKGKFAVIDADDAERILQHRWSATQTFPPDGTWYALTWDSGKLVYLHRVIVRAPVGLEVDHKDGDGLNCRKSNLRIATSGQNKRNARHSRYNSSGYRGVCFRKDIQKWVARVSINNRTVNLGTFADPVSAALAYDERVREVAGDFGCYNFPRSGEQAIRPALGVSRASSPETLHRAQSAPRETE